MTVTTDMVVARLPIDAEDIDATTVPLSTADIERFIEEATSAVNSAMNPSGRTLDTLSAEALAGVEGLIVSRAESLCLRKFGLKSTPSSQQEWEEGLERLGSAPRQIAGAGSRVRSNASGTARRYKNGYKF